MVTTASDGEAYEQANVHDVYDKIAGHFSSTRYKPWPVIDDFLQTLPSGSVGLDVGCGNGKYLTVRNDIYIVASDRSTELLKFATQHQPHSTAVADILSLPHPTGRFDFAISIAVVHHLSTLERRVEAIRTILQTLKSAASVDTTTVGQESTPEQAREGRGQGRAGAVAAAAGEALFFVWALEQKTSRRGWDMGDNQDQMVPWVLRPSKVSNGNTGEEPQTYHRYYHLFKEGELEDNIRAAGGEVVKSGYDRDNWWSIARRLE